MPKFQGKVAVVTGGSSGIGLATAKRFVEEGAFVYITGRRQTELDKAVSLIGDSVTAVQGDVSNLADLDQLYAKVASEKGKIDILCFGVVIPKPLFFLVAGARNHSHANRSRAFRFEVTTCCLVSSGIPCRAAYLGERPRNQETMRFR